MRRPLRVLSWVLLACLCFGLCVGGVANLRAAAARQRCNNNLRQIGLALQNYHDTMSEFPPGTHRVPDLPPDRRLSWLFEIDPFVHARMDPTWNQHQDEPWDSDGNMRLQRGRMPWYECPPRPSSVPMTELGYTSYVGAAGVGGDAPGLPKSDPRAGAFGYDRRVALGDIKDGPAQTIMVIETGTALGPWVAGGRATIRALERDVAPYLGRGRPFGGLHRGGVMVAMADGSVHFVMDSAAAEVLEAAVTIAAGEAPEIPFAN